MMNSNIQECECGVEQPITLKSKSINNNLLKFLFESYGNISNIMTLLDFIFKGKSKNRLIRYIQKCIPSCVIGYDLIQKIKKFYIAKHEDINSIQKKKIELILESNNYYTYSRADFDFNNEIIQWLLKSPKTDKFKIIKFYQISENKTFNYIESFDSYKELSILIKYNNKLYLLTCDIIKIMNTIYCNIRNLYSNADDWGDKDLLYKVIYLEYIKTLNYAKNVLCYDYSVEKRLRVTDVDFKFKNLNFNNFKNEIISSLVNEYRRGYILVGNPGTGKTSVLLRLENELIEYPIIYVTPNNIHNEDKIKTLFSFIDSINPCIVIFEDMDSFNLKEKNERLGVLLNYIDNNKDKLNVVYIATINDSCGLNYSLVRPGRFDQVIKIGEPQDNNEVYDIMKTHYYKQRSTNNFYNDKKFIKKNNLSWLTYRRLLYHKFTQADYCEIVQKIILQNKMFTNKTIIESRNELIKSKKALNEFKKDDC